ncbi:hypothetical protein [Paractinoplanes atraurantiacus]|uniref:hypothetical protein n=1 Tax=Paractinoplanes atraurantiacus TaxID=1036182 RepID=UPI0011778968|nr:hypothetical protein [Actinoplanes atraurantiacus]
MTLAGILLVPGTANASSKATPAMGVVDTAALQKATRRATTVNAKSEAKLQGKISGHLDKMARTGKLADTAEVQVATVAAPNGVDGKVQLVWDAGKDPAKVYTATVNGEIAGFGSIFNETETATTAAAAPVGSGYDAASNKSKMYKYSNGCVEQWFEPSAASIPDHYLWTCWEKWAESGTDHWIYNRWGRFSRANTSATPQTREFTIRSRPWNYTTNTAIKSLNSATPTATATSCTATATVEIGYERSGVSGKLSVPLHRCNATNPVGTWGRKEIGVQFLGSTTDVVRYLDMAGDYTAANKTVVPTWADYSWMTVAEDTTELPVLFEEDYIRKDSGW